MQKQRILLCQGVACKEPEKTSIQKSSSSIKESFQVDGPLVVHFDGKLLPAIDGSPEKEDRVAILVSVLGVEKLLGVPKVKQGTGKLVSEAVANILKDWRLTEKISAMSFNTTAANTGHINGTCAILEKKLSKKLLWFPDAKKSTVLKRSQL